MESLFGKRRVNNGNFIYFELRFDIGNAFAHAELSHLQRKCRPNEYGTSLFRRLCRTRRFLHLCNLRNTKSSNTKSSDDGEFSEFSLLSDVRRQSRKSNVVPCHCRKHVQLSDLRKRCGRKFSIDGKSSGSLH
jgi:hypothetical protein